MNEKARKYIDIMKTLEPAFFKAGSLACEMQSEALKSFKHETGSIDKDIVTDADIAVQEHVLKNILQTDLKHCHILAEEDTPSVAQFEADTDIYITIDPIDGTRSYAQGGPEFALIIALRTESEQLYTFYHYPIFNWTQIMEGKQYKEVGNPPKLDPPQGLSESVLYSFGDFLVGDEDPVLTELDKRKLNIIRKSEKFPQIKLGSTALFTAGYSAGYFASNPLCVDGLVCLHYAKAHNLPIYSKGPNGEFDFSLITETPTGHFHPGYYIVLR